MTLHPRLQRLCGEADKASLQAAVAMRKVEDMTINTQTAAERLEKAAKEMLETESETAK